MKDVSPNTDQSRLHPLQELTETWTITYKRPKLGAPIEARLMDWPNTTHYLVVGQGETIAEARLSLIVKLATEIAQDPDPDLTSPEAQEARQGAIDAALAAQKPRGSDEPWILGGE